MFDLFGKRYLLGVTDRELLIAIYLQQERMMTIQDDLSAKLDVLEAAVNQLGTDNAKALADLKTALGNVTNPDISSALARMDAVTAKLTQFDADDVAADVAANPPAPPVTPPAAPAT